MRGVPWEPVFGRSSKQIPVDVEDHGETTEVDEREDIPFEEMIVYDQKLHYVADQTSRMYPRRQCRSMGSPMDVQRAR